MSARGPSVAAGLLLLAAGVEVGLREPVVGRWIVALAVCGGVALAVLVVAVVLEAWLPARAQRRDARRRNMARRISR